MRKFYPFTKQFLLIMLACAGFQTLKAQNCGPIRENFDMAGGTNGGFTSSTPANPNSPGFTFGFVGTDGYLQRCGTTAGEVYQVTSPTYQSNPQSNTIGAGFELSGAAQASNVALWLEYFNSNTGMISSVFLVNATVNYTGGPGNQTALICETFQVNTIPGFTPGDNYRIVAQVTAATTSQQNQCIIFDDFRTTGIFTTVPLQQSTTCGPIVENFNNTGGTMADFTSFTQGSAAPGFVYGSTGADGYLQRCNVQANQVYIIHSPTYQTAVSQTFIGYGFELTGVAQASEINIFVEYTDPSNNITTQYIGTHYPEYTGGSQNFVARICDSVLISNIQGFTPGGKYRIYILISSNTNSNMNQCIELDDFRTTGFVSLIPLPVHFAQFEGRIANKNVVLLWSVSGEKDVLRYEVERSANGRDFEKIGSVTADGSTTYTYTDASPINGINFYRVRNVDADGAYKYTTIIRINLSKVVSVRAYPQPAMNEVIIEHGAVAVKGTITLVNQNGQVLRRVDVRPNLTQTQLNLSGLASGIYFVRFDNGNGQVENLKVVKQ